MSEELNEDLLRLAEKAVRPPKRGWETFIANKIALALYSQPLEEIRHICECVLTLTQEELKKVGISKEEVREIRKIHTLALTFINKYIEQLEANNPNRYVALPWPFGPEKIREWLYPWIQDEDIGAFQQLYYANMFSKKIKEGEKLTSYDVSRGLFPPSAYDLEGRFVRWAMPR